MRLSQFKPKMMALVLNEKREIWARTVKKNGKLSDSSARLTKEQAEEFLASGEAAWLDTESPARVEVVDRESYESYVRRMADAGVRVQPADWDAAMNRDH